MRVAVKFGDRVRMLRAARNLSQAQLASAAGISKPTMSYVESNRTKPQDTTRQVLSEALEVDPRALEDDATCFRELARILGVQEALAYREPPETSTTYREPPETSTSYREADDRLRRLIQDEVRRALEEERKRGK